MATFLWRTAWSVQSVSVGVCPSEAQLHGFLLYFPLVLNVTESFILNNSKIMSSLLKGSSTQGTAQDFFLCANYQEFYDYLPSVSGSFVTLACTALPRYS